MPKPPGPPKKSRLQRKLSALELVQARKPKKQPDPSFLDRVAQYIGACINRILGRA